MTQQWFLNYLNATTSTFSQAMNAKIEVAPIVDSEVIEIIEYLRICRDMSMPSVSKVLLTTFTVLNAPNNSKKYLIYNSIKISLRGEGQ
ncbi:hypothetical protein [Coleofasciculus sp. FACHB-SPT36]|uniref:hypothetical protein n=1 Tax=Coleofasciculus sp. FACHB-SPT36 TaxID=2692790 RepID=UPI00168AA876|nr:hypothetical protein [Coleofasciculus sp. FACHB-SPT36]MBD2541253.1 hypothetical protein [Coleofasciculus sp. FACHB-SPT36]